MKSKTWKISAAVLLMGMLSSTGVLAVELPKMPYVFGMYCFMCHRERVQIGPIGIFDMQSKEGNDLHPEYIRNQTRFGFNAMPSFRLSEVSEKELDEIVAYLKALAEYRKEHPGYQPTAENTGGADGR